MVCFFESAVCNEEGGRLKGFQLIQFHDVLSLLLILMLVTLMNDDADDGERYHLKSRQSRGDLAGECEKAMLSTFLRQSGHCFYFNLCIFLLNSNFAYFFSSFFIKTMSVSATLPPFCRKGSQGQWWQPKEDKISLKNRKAK